jgi:hypothetical protein
VVLADELGDAVEGELNLVDVADAVLSPDVE